MYCTGRRGMTVYSPLRKDELEGRAILQNSDIYQGQGYTPLNKTLK